MTDTNAIDVKETVEGDDMTRIMSNSEEPEQKVVVVTEKIHDTQQITTNNQVRRISFHV